MVNGGKNFVYGIISGYECRMSILKLYFCVWVSAMLYTRMERCFVYELKIIFDYNGYEKHKIKKNIHNILMARILHRFNNSTSTNGLLVFYYVYFDVRVSTKIFFFKSKLIIRHKMRWFGAFMRRRVDDEEDGTMKKDDKILF